MSGVPIDPPLPPGELDARLARLHHSLDTTELWPEVTAAERRTALDRVAGTVRRALDGGLSGPTELVARSQSELRALGIAAFTLGVGPLLGHWVREGRLAVDPGLGELLALHLEHGRLRARRLEAELRRIVGALAGGSVTVTVLKGSHTGRAYFPEPGTRPSADIDLLVSPADFGRASEVLRGLGLVERVTENLPHRVEWVPGGVPQGPRSLELAHVDNPWAVDLHASLDRAYFRGLVAGLGLPSPEDLEPWTGAIPAALVLRQPLLVAHLAVHASAHLPYLQLLRLVELVFVIRQDREAGRLRWTELQALLQRSGALRFAYPAFAMVERLAPGTVPPDLAERLAQAATARMRKVIARLPLASPQGLGHHSLDVRLVWAKGPREWLLNFGEVVFPTGPGVSREKLQFIWLRRLRLLLAGRLSWRVPRSDATTE